MERNSDVVFASACMCLCMSSVVPYLNIAADAPTLNHINGTQWTPDLITFNALTYVKSTSYYVQQMFATNMGTEVLSSTPTQGTGNSGLYWVASIDQNSNTYYLKVSANACSIRAKY
jgi:alpha-N-arabinofuranosidase